MGVMGVHLKIAIKKIILPRILTISSSIGRSADRLLMVAESGPVGGLANSGGMYNLEYVLLGCAIA